jgi:hypothetical protein
LGFVLGLFYYLALACWLAFVAFTSLIVQQSFITLQHFVEVSFNLHWFLLFLFLDLGFRVSILVNVGFLSWIFWLELDDTGSCLLPQHIFNVHLEMIENSKVVVDYMHASFVVDDLRFYYSCSKLIITPPPPLQLTKVLSLGCNG